MEWSTVVYSACLPVQRRPQCPALCSPVWSSPTATWGCSHSTEGCLPAPCTTYDGISRLRDSLKSLCVSAKRGWTTSKYGWTWIYYRKVTASNIECKEEQFIVWPTLGAGIAKGKTRKCSINHQYHLQEALRIFVDPQIAIPLLIYAKMRGCSWYTGKGGDTTFGNCWIRNVCDVKATVLNHWRQFCSSSLLIMW